jgi:hypothetical protein
MSTPPPIGMSAPPPPPPPPPASSRKGCFIAIAIVLGLIVLVCGGMCLGVKMAPGKFMAMMFGMGRQGFVQKVGSDVPAEKKAEFDTEYGAYMDWVRNATPADIKEKGEAVGAPMQYLRGALSDGSITADEIDRFVEMTRQVRGAAPPEPPASQPEPATPTTPASQDGATPPEASGPSGSNGATGATGAAPQVP